VVVVVQLLGGAGPGIDARYGWVGYGRFRFRLWHRRWVWWEGRLGREWILGLGHDGSSPRRERLSASLPSARSSSIYPLERAFSRSSRLGPRRSSPKRRPRRRLPPSRR